MLNALRLSRAPAAGLATIGAFWGHFAAWLPQIKTQAGVSDSTFGLLMVASALGGMAAMALAPRLRVALGPALMPLGAGLLAMAIYFPVGITGPVSLGLTMLAFGASMSLIDITANLRIADLEAEHDRPLMNLNHAIFSLSLAGGAVLAGLLRSVGVGYVASALVMMMVLSALAFLTVEADHPAHAPDRPEDAPPGLPWVVIVPAAAILFLSFVAENGTESWAAIHLERTLGAAPGHGAFGPAMFALTMGFGRLGGQALALRLGEARLIALSVSVAAVGAVLVALAPALPIAIVGMALLGIGVAVVVPSANSLLGRAVSAADRPASIARAWMIGFTGFFIGPPLLGIIAEGAGLRWSFIAIAVLLAVILPALARLVRGGRGW